jgi:hypothetical protein
MAKKQTRRCVSLNRSDYEAAKQEAARRGVTLASLVESALAAIGVPTVAHPQQTTALAQANAARRAESVASRRDKEVTTYRPSRRRRRRDLQAPGARGFQ